MANYRGVKYVTSSGFVRLLLAKRTYLGTPLLLYDTKLVRKKSSSLFTGHIRTCSVSLPVKICIRTFFSSNLLRDMRLLT